MMTFEMSADIGKLAEALAAAQALITAAPKSKTNPHFRSKYSDLDECWSVARAPLSSNGLSVVQMPWAEGKTVHVTTLLLHTSGQWLRSTLTVEAKDPFPQAVGSAITYGRRYGFCATVGITSDEDDDGEENRTQQQPQQKRTPPRAPKEAPPQPVSPVKQPDMWNPDNEVQVAQLKKLLFAANLSDMFVDVANEMRGREFTRGNIDLAIANIRAPG